MQSIDSICSCCYILKFDCSSSFFVHRLCNVFFPACVVRIQLYSSRNRILPERRQKEIYECNFFNLINEKPHIGHKLLRMMVVNDVHVNSLRPAMCERSLVVLFLNELSEAGKNNSPWPYCFQITSGHLTDKVERRRNCGNESGAPFNGSTSLVSFWIILWDFH